MLDSGVELEEQNPFEPSTLVLFKPAMLFQVSREKIEKTTFFKIQVEILEGSETGTKLESWRKAADFEWLRDELIVDFPSVVVPPLPSSNSGRLSSKSRDIEATNFKIFLEKVSDHVVLRRSDKLRLFLEANTERFHDVVQQCKDVAASRKRSLKSGFMQGLKKFGGLFRKKQEGDVARMTQGEEDAVGYVSAAKKSVNNFFKKTASVAKAQSRVALGLEELAASLKAFEVYEPNPILKSMWKSVEECISASSTAVEEASMCLDTMLGDFALYERANHQGFSDFVKTRASAQAEYVYESKQLSDAVSDRNKSSSAKKQATLDFEIARLERVVDFHEQRFRGVIDSMERERRRLVSEKAVMLANVLQASMGKQLLCAQKILEAADDPLHRIRTMELPSYSPAKPGDRSSFDAGNTSSSRSFRSSGPVAPQAVRPTVAPQPVRRPVSPSRAGPPKPAQVDPEQAAMRITAGPSASASSRASKASETAEAISSDV